MSKGLLAIEVGPRTVEMAQRMMHQVASGLAPGCVPAWLSDGFKGYRPAILGHCGGWTPPERRQDKGPTSLGARLNLDMRQRVAAIGRRGNTLCQGEDGWRHQLALFHVYHNFIVPHASLRQPPRVPEPTHGTGSARLWQPRPPAMAAGRTDHVWTLREGRL